MVSELKHAVATGPTIQLAKTQAIQSGLNGKKHTPAHTGHTAKAAPDFAAGMKRREIKANKPIIFNFMICCF